MKTPHKLHGKKLLPLLILLLFTLSLLSALNVNIASVSAVESPYIVVVPESIVDLTLISGDNFTISIYTNYGENVMTEWDVTSYQFSLYYNPNVLNGVNVTNGDVIVDGPTDFVATPFNNEAGNLTIAHGFYTGLGQVTGMYRWPGPFNGTLAYVSFTVVGKGTSNITLGPQTKLIGWNFNETRDYSIINATVTNTDTWTGNGVTSVFYTTEKPIAIYSEKVYVNQTLMSRPADYTIDYDTGEITFTTAPSLGEEIEATYDYINYDHIQHGYFDNRFQHDVAVGSVTAPDKAAVGKRVPINVTVANIGKSPEVANITIRYDTTIIDSQNITLGAGENKPVSFSWNTTGAPQGPYTINATATIAGDGDLTDNWKNTTILLSLHNVAVVSVTAPDKKAVGEPVSINVTVANEGSYDEDVTLTVYNQTWNESTVIDSTTFTLAKGGASNKVSFSWDTSGAANGTYTINATATVLVSAENPTGIDEDLSDNWKNTTTFLVAHDVAVVNVTAPATAVPGEIVPINVTVANIGASPEVANVTIRYDTTIIDSQNVTLGAGENKPVSFSWNTTGAPQGPNTINATATIAGDEDLTDNWKNTTILIAIHDVAVGDISAPTVYVGECVDIKVLVENNGWYRETFEEKVTVSFDTTVIETQTQNVTLPGDEDKHVFFSWNTTGVAPGSYTITAEAILDGDVDPTNNIDTLSFTLEFPPGAIAGTVTDSSTNDPIEGANVTANGYSDTTDVDGHYNITDVPPGSYTVTVSAAKRINQSKTATVTPSATTVLDFILTPLNGTISGTVTESSTGDPVSGASVTANGVSVSTDADGSYSIELAPGTYNVTVSADGYESDSQSATVVAGKTSIVDFELTTTPSPNIPWQLYVAIAGVAAIVMVALAFYFLRIRKTKPT